VGGLVTASRATDVGLWGVLPVMIVGLALAGGWVLYENGHFSN